jgi:hypothetical protein
MPSCPRGHDTAATDYCDECGSPIGLPASPGEESLASAPGEPQAAPAPETTAATGTSNGWLVVAYANRDYHEHMIAMAPQFAELADIPGHYPKRHFALNGSQLLIGRRSRSRGIEPDIDLTGPPEDPGVSHAHALLIANPDGGWSLMDAESANGTYTYVNGQYKPIEPRQPVPLKNGDQIHLGAWTTLTLRSPFSRRRGLLL